MGQDSFVTTKKIILALVALVASIVLPWWLGFFLMLLVLFWWPSGGPVLLVVFALWLDLLPGIPFFFGEMKVFFPFTLSALVLIWAIGHLRESVFFYNH